MSNVRCQECGNNSGKWIFKTTERHYCGDGYDFVLNVNIPYCEKCGALIFDKEIEDGITTAANEKIREQKSILTKNEILGIVEYYKVSQKFLSKVLGWGEITLARYISGNYTPNENNNILLKAIKNPYVLYDLLETNISESDFKSKNKLKDNIVLRIKEIEKKRGKLYSAVNWFISNTEGEEGITPLALQKALYFAQAWSYILNQKWLFSEECEAWVHGAVYSSVYEDFCFFKSRQIPQIAIETNLDEKEVEVLEFVKKFYVDVYSAKALEKICHLEEPYISTRKGLKDDEPSNRIIEKKAILKYYKKISEAYGVSKENKSQVNRYLNDLIMRSI